MSRVLPLIALSFFLAAGAAVLFTSGDSKGPGTHRKPKPSREEAEGVLVAAVQVFSPMARGEENRAELTGLVRMAASEGARIVVLPETAVQGYLAPDGSRAWCSPDFPGDEKERSLEGFAETVPGPSTRAFARLSKELSIYLLLPLIEVCDHKYYNTAVLLDPKGEIALHYRKAHPWTVAEYGWTAKGDGIPAVADTEYGRLGVMICYDVHEMFEPLAKAGARLVLWPVWWVDEDPGFWFGERLPKRCRRLNVAVATANRAALHVPGELSGAGYSSIISAQGDVLGRAADENTDVVIARVVLGR